MKIMTTPKIIKTSHSLLDFGRLVLGEPSMKSLYHYCSSPRIV